MVSAIRAALGSDRTLFHYFRDRYALMLLEWFVGEGKTVREVKRSRYGRLLQKPCVREWLARGGGDRLTPDRLAGIWPSRSESYVVTLDEWRETPGFRDREVDQTTRRGSSLVLQLNFSRRHDVAFEALLGEDASSEGWLNSSLHPVNLDGRRTLAWARLDVELDLDEVLIEEVQSDWAFWATWLASLARQRKSSMRVLGRVVEVWRARRYLEEVLHPHLVMWDEAVLAAVLDFIRRELGVRRVYYHSYDSSTHFKCCEPPRSLYARLPRRFCFEETPEPPRIVEEASASDNFIRCALKNRRFRWFRLEL